LLDQLAVGGRLVMPVGSSEEQMLQVFQLQDGKMLKENLIPCRFVPFVGVESAAE
jgi:protein-L-isoaspartate(D-aspartate) O-methyltransferase